MPGQFTGNRGQAQEFLMQFIQEGLSNSQIVSAIRDEGLGYRLQNMYADINRTRLEQFAGEGLRNLDQFTPIPEKLMREWQGDTTYNYRVVVRYEYTPSSGGDPVKAATTMYYNERPSIDNVMEDWQVRVKTIESGALGYEQVGQIESMTEVNYFVNRPKE